MWTTRGSRFFFALRQICPPRIWLPAGTHWGGIGQILKRLPFVLDVWVRKGETHLQTSFQHVLSWASGALRSRRERGMALLPASDTPSLMDPVSNFAEFLTLFCEPISRKSHDVPKIEAVKSAQDVTSKSGTSLIPRPDQKASRLLIFWITYLDNCYLTNGSKLSQTKLSPVSCWHDLSEIIIFVQ